ncbi:MAG: SAM-dependent chlorinase/fluorinase [Pseudoflavonifractor sp.]
MSNLSQKPAIVMQTDFTKDISTCTMEGVCMLVDPELRIFDSTHNIPGFQTYIASTSLAFIVDYWPQGTVFVSVVDPGVGTSRRGCVALLKNGSYVVTPDNGSLTHMLLHPGIEAIRQIDETVNRLPGSGGVNIFHGRDVFAYTAARLASGKITFEQVGPVYPLEEIVTHPIIAPKAEGGKLSGMIEAADFHFGLVSSNIPMALFAENGIAYGDSLDVVITGEGREVFHGPVPYVPSFGSVPKGAALLMNSEMRTIQIAVNQENMTEKYGISCGSDWLISCEKQNA